MICNSGDSSQQRALRYRPDIDGLRAVAVTSVLAYHAGIGFISGGFVGVDVFFVISGFLIGSLVYEEIRQESFSIAKFYERRAKRILPALFGVLLFSYVAAYLLLGPNELKLFSGSALATITSGSNLYFWRTKSYFNPNSELNPLLMTWSLGVEEQFYILFPPLMLSLRRKSWVTQFAAIATVVGLSLTASIWGVAHHPVLAFYLLPTRAWELGAGILLAIMQRNSHSKDGPLSLPVQNFFGVFGLGLIGLAMCHLDHNTPFPGYAALLPVLGTVLILSSQRSIVSLLLSWKPFVFIGLTSYSWYLWHWPLLAFARGASATPLSKAAAVSVVLLSYCFALLSYQFIEKPFRRPSTETTRRLLRYALLCLAMMLPAVFFYKNEGLPQRNKEVTEVEATASDPNAAECLVAEPETRPSTSPSCIPPGGGPTVALIGDSHAAELAEALRTIAGSAGYRLIEMTKGWCPPLAEVTRTVQDTPEFASHCQQFNRARIDHVLRDPEIQIVIAAGFWADALRADDLGARYVLGSQNPQTLSVAQSAVYMERGLESLASRLDAAHKVLYLVQDDPEFPFSPPELELSRLSAPRRMLATLFQDPMLDATKGIAPFPNSPASEEARMAIARVAARHPNVHLIDLQSALCHEDGCQFAKDNKLFYVDRAHLSTIGARAALSGVRLR